MQSGIAELIKVWVTLKEEQQVQYLDLFNRGASFLGHPDLFSKDDVHSKKAKES